MTSFSRYSCATDPPRPFTTSLVCVVALVLIAASRVVASEAIVDPHPGEGERQRVQLVVEDLRARLALSHHVAVSVVDANPLVVSVRPAPDRQGVFELSVEADFLRELTDEELGAVVAHELGHVWIFTNHPYLHTESLANQIAMRVVTRESLEQVYGKLTARGRMKGSVVRFKDD
jgi:hypothetical protein